MKRSWIPCEIATFEKPQVIQISVATGLSREEVLGRLMRFWGWASEVSDDGILHGIGPEHLIAQFGYDMDFWVAVKRAGWLEKTDDGILLPNATDWISRGGRARMMAARRMNEMRQRKEKECCADVTPVPSRKNDLQGTGTGDRDNPLKIPALAR